MKFVVNILFQYFVCLVSYTIWHQFVFCLVDHYICKNLYEYNFHFLIYLTGKFVIFFKLSYERHKSPPPLISLKFCQFWDTQEIWTMFFLFPTFRFSDLFEEFLFSSVFLICTLLVFGNLKISATMVLYLVPTLQTSLTISVYRWMAEVLN